MAVNIGDVLRWLVDASAQDAATVRKVLDALHPTIGKQDVIDGGPTLPKVSGFKTSSRRPKPPKAKRRSPFAFKPYGTFKDPTSTTAKIFDALKGSSGPLTAKEVAELFGLKINRASALLGALHEGRNGAVIKREALTRKGADGMVTRYFAYRYVPREASKGGAS